MRSWSHIAGSWGCGWQMTPFHYERRAPGGRTRHSWPCGSRRNSPRTGNCGVYGFVRLGFLCPAEHGHWPRDAIALIFKYYLDRCKNFIGAKQPEEKLIEHERTRSRLSVRCHSPRHLTQPLWVLGLDVLRLVYVGLRELGEGSVTSHCPARSIKGMSVLLDGNIVCSTVPRAYVSPKT